MSGTYTNPFGNVNLPVTISPGPLTVNGTSNLNGPVNVDPGPLTVNGLTRTTTEEIGYNSGFPTVTNELHGDKWIRFRPTVPNANQILFDVDNPTGAATLVVNSENVNSAASLFLTSPPNATVAGTATLVFGSFIGGQYLGRIVFVLSGLEPGANVGSDLTIQTRADVTGALLFNAITITRSTGQVRFGGNSGVIRLDQTPPAFTVVPLTNYFNINLNGTVYRVPCVI
jgi:hypothetical protein